MSYKSNIYYSYRARKEYLKSVKTSAEELAIQLEEQLSNSDYDHTKFETGCGKVIGESEFIRNSVITIPLVFGFKFRKHRHWGSRIYRDDEHIDGSLLSELLAIIANKPNMFHNYSFITVNDVIQEFDWGDDWGYGGTYICSVIQFHFVEDEQEKYYDREVLLSDYIESI
jgi:hypothetical protein